MKSDSVKHINLLNNICESFLVAINFHCGNVLFSSLCSEGDKKTVAISSLKSFSLQQITQKTRLYFASFHRINTYFPTRRHFFSQCLLVFMTFLKASVWWYYHFRHRMPLFFILYCTSVSSDLDYFLLLYLQL